MASEGHHCFFLSKLREELMTLCHKKIPMRKSKNNNKIMEESKGITKSFHEMAGGLLDSQIEISEGMILTDLANDFNDISILLNSYIREISQVLSHLSAGDMTVKINDSVSFKGDFVPINNALTKISYSLNNTFTAISELSGDIDNMCDELDNSSNTIAKNASEQAKLILDLSDTMNDITNKTSENTEYAKLASKNALDAQNEAKEGELFMNQMLSSMDGVKSSTNEISHIIEMIKNIAAQTKLLSLNASIEAARAGENGRGFAVVADQVGNLASQSALAVSQTTKLIENNIEKVNESTEIANKTAKIFSRIYKSIEKTAELNAHIVESSEAQEISFQNTTNIITDISDVVQANAAFAEEGATNVASMLEKSNALKELIVNFRVKGQKTALVNNIEADSKYDHELMNELIISLKDSNSLNARDDVLRRKLEGKSEIECFYIIDKVGIQISHTIMNSNVLSDDSLNFEPSQPGTDNSAKKYFRQAIILNGAVYSTPDYISGATGKLCRTVSALYKALDQNEYVICADISCKF